MGSIFCCIQPPTLPRTKSEKVQVRKPLRPTFITLPIPLRELKRKLNTISKKNFWRVIDASDFSDLNDVSSQSEIGQLFIKQTLANPFFTEMYATLL